MTFTCCPSWCAFECKANCNPPGAKYFLEGHSYKFPIDFLQDSFSFHFIIKWIFCKWIFIFKNVFPTCNFAQSQWNWIKIYPKTGKFNSIHNFKEVDLQRWFHHTVWPILWLLYVYWEKRRTVPWKYEFLHTKPLVMSVSRVFLSGPFISPAISKQQTYTNQYDWVDKLVEFQQKFLVRQILPHNQPKTEILLCMAARRL